MVLQNNVLILTAHMNSTSTTSLPASPTHLPSMTKGNSLQPRRSSLNVGALNEPQTRWQSVFFSSVKELLDDKEMQRYEMQRHPNTNLKALSGKPSSHKPAYPPVPTVSPVQASTERGNEGALRLAPGSSGRIPSRLNLPLSNTKESPIPLNIPSSNHAFLSRFPQGLASAPLENGRDWCWRSEISNDTSPTRVVAPIMEESSVKNPLGSLGVQLPDFNPHRYSSLASNLQLPHPGVASTSRRRNISASGHHSTGGGRGEIRFLRHEESLSERPKTAQTCDQHALHANHHARIEVQDIPNNVSRRCDAKSSLPELHMKPSEKHNMANVFIQNVIDQANIKLGTEVEGARDHGMGDSWWVSNPTIGDNPIVMVSPGFLESTGYERDQIVGRNVFSLVEETTSPSVTSRLRTSFWKKENCTEILFYYRKDSIPICFIVNVMPLFDVQGDLTYFIGGHMRVSGDFEAFHRILSAVPAVIHSTTFGTDRRLSYQHLDIQHLSSGGEETDNQPWSRRIVSHQSTAQLPRSIRGTSRCLPTSPFLGIAESLSKSKEGCVGQLEKVGVEPLFSARALAVYSQVHRFETIFSRIIIFQRKTRQIIYATPGALKFLDVSSDEAAPSNCYFSPLLETDFITLVSGEDRKESKRLVSAISRVLNKSIAASFDCRLSFKAVDQNENFQGHSVDHSLAKHHRDISSTVHLTPLIDSSGHCKAYSVIMETRDS